MAPVQEDNIFQQIRTSCAAVRPLSNHVDIDETAIPTFLEQLNYDDIEKNKAKGLPLKFETVKEEINFHVLFGLLNGGSGFRHALHKAIGRGAADTILFALMSMHLGGKRLDAEFMSGFDIPMVEEFFGFKANQDSEVITAVYTEEASPLSRLAHYIASCLRDCGRILRNHDKSSFAEFILDILETNPVSPARTLVTALVKSFPDHLNDVSPYKDGDMKVYMHKKAQLIVGELFRHLGPRDPRFHFSDIADMTVFTDNVLPTVLRDAGILILTPQLLGKINDRKSLKHNSEEEVELRCLSITAAELIIAAQHELHCREQAPYPLTALDLDYFLWQHGKSSPDRRKLERHATRDTFLY